MMSVAAVFCTRTLRRSSIAVLSTLLVSACGDDGVVNTPPRPAQGLVVLDGFIQPGLTLVADSGSSSSRLTFGPSTEFDGGGFTLERDTVLAVSSRAAGDLLYLADLTSGTVKRVQLPAGSNPAKA
ncbi:MAG: hypothetical protein IT354_05815, partial [Gemmatimonadaceae bacterium]|nr:hypothetical protein [Gemmatimonadaceae bacterium]